VTDETPTPVPRTTRAKKPVEPTEPVALVEPSTTAAVETPAAVDAPADTPEVVEVPAETAEVDNTEVLPPASEPVVTAPAVQTVYVQAPTPPRKRSNRAVGTIIAVLSTVIFAIVFAIVVAIIGAAETGVFSFSFVSDFSFYVPVLFFLVGFVLLVLIVNRANWWAHVFGSVFVALFVYFGTVGTLLLLNNVVGHTPSEAGRMFATALVNPLVVAAALVAREVALWMGFAISARGRRLKVRNAEARTSYEAEVAEKRAEYERANSVA
jgi:hypothetical protein